MIHLWAENGCQKLPLKRRLLQFRDTFGERCLKVQVFKPISNGGLHDQMIRQHFKRVMWMSFSRGFLMDMS